MSVSLLRGLGLFAPLLLIAQAAHADLKAEDVWSDWKAYLTSTGYDVTADEATSGDTLTVSEVVLSSKFDGNAIDISIDEMQFVTNRDGTVSVNIPSELPVEYDASVDGEEIKGTLIYTHAGNSMMVSGDTSRMTYDYQTPNASLSLDELEIDGESLGSEIAAFTMTMTDIVSNTVMEIGEQRSYSQTLTTSALAYDFMFQDPEDGTNGKFSGALQGLKANGQMVLPDVADSSDIAALLQAGLRYVGAFTFEKGTTSVNAVEGENNFALQTSSQGGSVDMGISPEGLSYDFIQNDATLSVMGSDIPFPIALSMAELGLNFAMPMAKSDKDQNFALGLALRDFAVPEMLWGLIDPTGELPHDPATLVVDLSGKGKLLVDLADEAQMAAVENGETAPGELSAININEVLLSAAGAELTGAGAFTFDNTDLESFDGMPAPEGEANLRLSGANTLIDTLIGMGLLSEDDAMGARMMLGMFSVPAGDDVVTSKIEVNDKGHVLANGQRLK